MRDIIEALLLFASVRHQADEVECEQFDMDTVVNQVPAQLTPEEQAKVFTPFTRFHQTRIKGHGLGLSIIQHIVKKLGSRVGMSSAGLGQGCTFWFVLLSC
ncbi:MAG: ATP-binding protein [Chloroflexi bacterium]|nr:ATP-binding protein [Chloroflexota bacterium]